MDKPYVRKLEIEAERRRLHGRIRSLRSKQKHVKPFRSAGIEASIKGFQQQLQALGKVVTPTKGGKHGNVGSTHFASNG